MSSDAALHIFLGWLLGILGVHVVERVRDSYRRGEIRKALAVELNELRVRLAITAAEMRQRSGTLDTSFIAWIKPILAEYRGFYSKSGLLEGYESLERWGDEKIRQVLEVWNAKRGDTGLHLKKMAAPFLTASIPSLTLFSPEFQQIALEVAARLENINEEEGAAWFYMQKTFDPNAGAENLKKLKANAESSYRSVGRMSEDVASLIGKLLAVRK
jgi:hypothetical protein